MFIFIEDLACPRLWDNGILLFLRELAPVTDYDDTSGYFLGSYLHLVQYQSNYELFGLDEVVLFAYIKHRLRSIDVYEQGKTPAD